MFTADEPSPLLISVREAARILGIGRDLTYELIRQGRLPSVRLGRRILVPRYGLAAWVNGAITKPEPSTGEGIGTPSDVG